MSKLREQLIEFHKMVDQPILDKPQIPSEDRVRLRAALIAEEFFETMEAIFPDDDYLRDAKEATETAFRYGKVSVNMPELADGMADLDYVVEGTRIEFGIDGGPIADEVHRANMDKQAGPKRPDGKIMKPPGWKPPNIAGCLFQQGWEKQQEDD